MDIEELAAMLRERVESAVARGAPTPTKRAAFDLGPAGTLMLDGTARPPVVATGAGGAADCTLTLSAGDLAAILGGELDPTGAFMTGRLKIAGDTGLAMQLATLMG
ncbi:SCP2 sterol-binding domain-containing protein [Acidisphaera rubrifaciens]|uniref:Sterol-binding domain-containing protein n=1 Tax=Acidisphaera rubrifaciens HS-AP3 TaxID=1231350 RepID=A0A0D6P6S6_9PROT|nr:SCP2 sterol-binding domain-containing protein [Acidisphaera rubrifaciens]GAN76574.1 sterol-binding domain-containing protein [Acidisphaera rubrifaciens HS-AP3]